MFVTKPEDHVIADVLEKAPGEKSPKSVSSDFIAKIYSDTEGLGFRVWGSGFRTFENFCPSSCWPFSSPMSLPLSRLLPEDLDDEALEGLDRCAFCSFFRSFLPFFPFLSFFFSFASFLALLGLLCRFLVHARVPILVRLAPAGGRVCVLAGRVCVLAVCALPPFHHRNPSCYSGQSLREFERTNEGTRSLEGSQRGRLCRASPAANFSRRRDTASTPPVRRARALQHRRNNIARTDAASALIGSQVARLLLV